jgi:hypothetical protein
LIYQFIPLKAIKWCRDLVSWFWINWHTKQYSHVVLVDPQITAACYAAASITYNITQEAFNGNDPMGLFKNGVPYRYYRNIQRSSSNFAADEDMRGKPYFCIQNATFNKTLLWDGMYI